MEDEYDADLAEAIRLSLMDQGDSGATATTTKRTRIKKEEIDHPIIILDDSDDDGGDDIKNDKGLVKQASGRLTILNIFVLQNIDIIRLLNSGLRRKMKRIHSLSKRKIKSRKNETKAKLKQ
ncbi:hypothetical protein TWF730_005689 [Orbilia blumenaviensis]|uniref:Uncharacterized protein n=1 Tax=Orbilia blumenaviensis TaxID=1796055 RepID=A0AAV9VJB8_9PEZI